MESIHIDIRFIQPILGTASADPEIHERFIASKAPDAPSLKEEVEALGADEVAERGTTVFPRRHDGTPFLWDYQVKGFCKDACKAMREADGSVSGNIPAYKSKIDTLVFVSPRNINLNMPEGGEVKIMQRPLRAETAQGPRVALASSEMLPAGTECSFDITTLAQKVGTRKTANLRDAILEWFSYGQLRGIGQWRNAGWGSFVCRVTDNKTGEVIFDNMG